MATQATINPYLAFDGLAHMADGRGARDALEAVIAGDPGATSASAG